MKVFKRGSMMQEHPSRQASQRGRQRQLEGPAQIFEFSLEVDAPNINEII
jgi:hypothetical protein